MKPEDIIEIRADLKKVGEQLKSHHDDTEKQVKRAGEINAETRASVDKLLNEQGALTQRLNAAEQQLARVEALRDSMPGARKSLGQQVAATAEVRAMAEAGRGKARVVLPNATITSDAASAGDLIVPDRKGLIPTPQRRLTIRDLLAKGRTTSNSVEFVRELAFTNNAAPVSENPASGKPESNITFEDASAPVRTIAHFVRATKQVLADAAMLASYIDGRLRYGLLLKEEAQLLLGSGAGLNINGIYTQAATYANPGVVVQAENQMDRLRLAMLQSALAEYEADGIVLNPIDWTDIELTKDTTNRLIIGNPQGSVAPTLWNRPVVSTASMTAGTFLVGSFSQGAMLWDREDVAVIVSTEDGDNITTNRVTILVENRVALTVFRDTAFVKGDFAGTQSE